MYFRGQAIKNSPSYRPRPWHLRNYYCFRDPTFEAFVSEHALRAIADAAREAAPNETIGHLIGRPYQDKQGMYLIVTTALPALTARRSRSFVETTIVDEQTTADHVEVNEPTAERVGWWHSHPFDLFRYSEVDRDNQRLSCPAAYQLGLLACLVDGEVRIQAYLGPQSRIIGNTFCFDDVHFNRDGAFITTSDSRSLSDESESVGVSSVQISRAMAIAMLLIATGVPLLVLSRRNAPAEQERGLAKLENELSSPSSVRPTAAGAQCSDCSNAVASLRHELAELSEVVACLSAQLGNAELCAVPQQADSGGNSIEVLAPAVSDR